MCFLGRSTRTEVIIANIREGDNQLKAKLFGNVVEPVWLDCLHRDM
jgi:hypothetical protein